MTDYQSILTAASHLPVSDRLRLIDDLASSVPSDRPPILSVQWQKEIERRLQEVDTGKVQTESWDSIRELLFEKYGIHPEPLKAATLEFFEDAESVKLVDDPEIPDSQYVTITVKANCSPKEAVALRQQWRQRIEEQFGADADRIHLALEIS